MIGVLVRGLSEVDNPEIAYICSVCSIDESLGWTHRAGYWLCSKCSQIPVAVFGAAARWVFP